MCCLFVAVGCMASDEAAGNEYIDEDFPPWSCDTDAMTGTGQPCETEGEPALDCQSAEDCPGEFCAASFNGDIGPFECQSQCIDLMDDNRWCSDAEACCDADAICDRGYCILPDGADTTDASTSLDPSTSGDTTGDASSSTDTGTDTGTGTETGTDTGTTEGSTTSGG